jgi:hypothetical protein
MVLQTEITAVENLMNEQSLPMADDLLASDLPLKGLPEKYAQFKDCFLHDPFGNQLYDVVCQIAIDTEWYSVGDRNCIISYQVAAVLFGRAVNRIIYVRPGERLTLMDLIERAFAFLYGGEVPPNFKKDNQRILIVLIAHNFVAEWSALKDRDEKYIVDKLSPIRKCPVTGIEPITYFSSLLGDVAVHVYDTMVLAPVGFQSLDKLSSLLSNNDSGKVDILQFHIENMNRLREDDPEKFERYALRDTELTIKLFVHLQEALNRLAYGEIRQVFKTLAAAAVKGFQVKHPKFKKYRKALKAEEFSDAYKLIMRSYHGGRNEGFLIGDSRD